MACTGTWNQLIRVNVACSSWARLGICSMHIALEGLTSPLSLSYSLSFV